MAPGQQLPLLAALARAARAAFAGECVQDALACDQAALPNKFEVEMAWSQAEAGAAFSAWLGAGAAAMVCLPPSCGADARGGVALGEAHLGAFLLCVTALADDARCAGVVHGSVQGFVDVGVRLISVVVAP
ncbi:unnamed protein product, partial [Prorocentrum cordatum]